VEIHEYRGHLPHWRLDGATYAVTWRLHRSQAPMTPAERADVVSSLRQVDSLRYELIAFVVMDDHVHVVVSPQAEWRLDQIVHSWKSFTAHQWVRTFGRTSPVWQDESYDRILRDEQELVRTAEYVLDNPFRRWDDIESYP